MKVSEQHRKKFYGFLHLIEEIKKASLLDDQPQLVMVKDPWVLGDNYDEIVTNLGLLSESGLLLGFSGSDEHK